MTTKLTAVIFAIYFILIPISSFADIPEPLFEPLSHDGPFVEVPATVGGLIVVVPVVIIAYVICTPTAYLYDLDNDSTTYDTCMSVPSRAAAVTGAVLVGGIFYIIKKIFWDFPQWLFTKTSAPGISLIAEPFYIDKLMEDERHIPQVIETIDTNEILA